jgi:hypothetical protein
METPAQQRGPQAAAAGYGEPDAEGYEASHRREGSSAAAAAAAAAGEEDRPRRVAKATAATAAGARQQRDREVKEPQLAQGSAKAATAAAAMQQGNTGEFGGLLVQIVERRDTATAQRAYEAGRREAQLERKNNELKRKLEQVASKAAAAGMQDSFALTEVQQANKRLKALLSRVGEHYSCSEQQ